MASAAPAPAQIPKTHEEWQAVLSPEQFRILRKKGTEFKNVSLYSPDGSLLVRDLSFQVVTGQSVIIMGPNGRRTRPNYQSTTPGRDILPFPSSYSIALFILLVWNSSAIALKYCPMLKIL